MLKKIVKLIILLVVFYGIARFVVVYKDSLLTGSREPYLQMLSTDSVVIRWLTDDNNVGIMHYGEDVNHMASVKVESGSGKNHSVTITDLKPATKYYYNIGKLEKYYPFDADKHWFYTQPVEQVSSRIWVMGDSGKAGKVQVKVRDGAIKWMQNNSLPGRVSSADETNSLMDVWLILGDIAYRSGTNEQFQRSLFDVYENLLSNTSLWPVYGNHDDRRWTYFRVFDMPENAEAGGLASHTESYYSFDYSNIHFVVLDSQDSDRSADGEMARWLRKDLAFNIKPWVITAFHHPPYSKGSHDSDDAYDSRGRMQDMRENIVPILEKFGVDLVLSGHSHMYERSYLIDCAYTSSDQFSQKNIVSNGVNNQHTEYVKMLSDKRNDVKNSGTVYLVSGSASKVDNGPMDHPAHHVGLKKAGSVVIDVVENELTARFINKKGRVKDQFSIKKTAGYKSDYQGCQLN